MLVKKKFKFNGFRTWVELDSAAAKHNLEIFRKLTGSRSKIMSVVKSNAYDHGIKKQFSKFIKAENILRSAGSKAFARHVAATGGTLISPEYH